jgi:hypothetical protein
LYTLNANAKKTVHFQTFCKKLKVIFLAISINLRLIPIEIPKKSIKLKPPNVRTAAKLEGDIVRGNAGPKLENWNMRGYGLCHL